MLVRAAAFLATALLAAPAAAITIDFDELRPAGGRTFVYGAYEANGFRLSSSNCPVSGTNGRAQCFVTSANTINNIDRAGAALVNFAGGATVSLGRVDGGLFALQSMALASNSNNAGGFGPATQAALFIFALADGRTLIETRTIASTGTANRNLLSFDLGPLTGFSFRPTTGTGGFLQFDDISVTPLAAAAIPEPASWATMIGGFGLIGAALRRRARPVAA